jgi:hemolysin III
MRDQTTNEEIINTVTHGVGALLSIFALTILVSLASVRGNTWQVVSFSVYGTTLLVLYLSSTLYHYFVSPRIKRIFQLADHAAIFLFIAGTYTPFTLVSLRGPWGWTLFGLAWGLAITGVALTVFFLDRFRVLFAVLYLAMGWLVVIAFKPLLSAIPLEGILWIVGGGFFYSIGIIFYLWSNLRYGHAVWHVFVLAGSICHFFAILLHVLPGPQS